MMRFLDLSNFRCLDSNYCDGFADMDCYPAAADMYCDDE